ncbi:hypothetical protein PT974_03501 [Cladobotryum mycophilum]|uniref:Peptidase metallopeptidase domain-containing protein n=1 Tax=Cladobotryum mycophilum TaxID=491253 RepID=A0ABR0SSG3_9HYPO
MATENTFENVVDIGPYEIRCQTQTSSVKGDQSSLVVGWKGECPRWIPGSVITWAIGQDWQDDADDEANRLHSVEQFKNAAERWNSANIHVTFKQVDSPDDATFVVVRGGRHPRSAAEAFFPNSNKDNAVVIYDVCFIPLYRDKMWQILLHELGHVLGLRHEFALIDEEGDDATQFGVKNAYSVMSYPRPVNQKKLPELRDTDIEHTRKYYELEVGRVIDRVQVVDYNPDPNAE